MQVDAAVAAVATPGTGAAADATRAVTVGHRRVWNYVVTAHKPTAVTHSVVGNFTAPGDTNLILCRCTRLEIYKLTEEDIVPMMDVGIYGRVSALQIFRPPGSAQDNLLLCTERYHFMILRYDVAKKEIACIHSCEVNDRVARPCEGGHIVVIEQRLRCIAMLLYDGQLKIMPMDASGLITDAYDIRMEETKVVDMQFQHVNGNPVLVLLHQDHKDARHVKTYELNLRKKTMTDGPWSLANVESGTTMLIPIPQPLGGVIVVGEQTITYHSGTTDGGYKSHSIPATAMLVNGRIDADGSRHLLVDHQGVLHVLMLQHDGAKVLNVDLVRLGKVCHASALSYLDNGVVFVGSTFGDSLLIRLLEKAPAGNQFEEIDRFPNLGPIVDFCVVDLDKQGQGQVVTCSGAFSDGSLRIIRNGIGINQQACLDDLPGIRGLWSLRSPATPTLDTYLVVSFVGETRMLALSAQSEMEEVEVPGFDMQSQTLYCGNVSDMYILQVVAGGVYLVDGTSLMQLSAWHPPQQTFIKVVSCYDRQILLSTGSGLLTYLEVRGDKITSVGETRLPHEIASVDVGGALCAATPQPSALCAVGLWDDFSLRVLRLPSFEQVCSAVLEETVPRSVLLAKFEDVNYALAGMGDGHLYSFVLDLEQQQLRERKKLMLGSSPVQLCPFHARPTTVFACSDRPTIIYSNNRKLLYSNVNLKEVSHMCRFNNVVVPDSIALATEDSIRIGTIDEIQKLHIRTIPLDEAPRRIAYQEESKTFCVLTVATTADDQEPNFVRLFDSQTFETTDRFGLEKYENGCSILSAVLSDDPRAVYVVGTAFAPPEEVEPSKGRILVFSVKNRKLELTSELQVKGAVYSLESFVGGRLLAAINSKIQLYNWTDPQDSSATNNRYGKVLVPHCHHRGHILALFTATRGEYIIVGDLLKSVSLLAYHPTEGKIEEVAHDFNPSWMSAVEMLDEDTYLGAENSFNLFTLARNSEATNDEERQRLDVVGEFHLGEFVNRFRHGSLVMKTMESETHNVPTVLFGTVNGVIGVVASLPQADYDFFLRVQNRLAGVVGSVGRLSHEEWRSFCNDRRTEPSINFLDGDLIESFLDLSREKMGEVVAGLGVSVEELSKRIECLQRATH
eukprot:TRINITY_DN4133_c0_g1_i1.p1 TRINITY_DN4133_c0_g1~~TRINITY_DN4133_c0_g1_i1.p1  ORF type:complete len:1128 (+),score=278.84 TRINITY_DN4133_c0_g1_i1:36-3419(+)